MAATERFVDEKKAADSDIGRWNLGNDLNNLKAVMVSKSQAETEFIT